MWSTVACCQVKYKPIRMRYFWSRVYAVKVREIASLWSYFRNYKELLEQFLLILVWLFFNIFLFFIRVFDECESRRHVQAAIVISVSI